MQSVTLSGYVYEADGTTPIEGANVNLTERSSLPPTAKDTMSLPSGKLALTAGPANSPLHPHGGEYRTDPGNDVQQNFILNAMPRVTVSGVVNTNDIPAESKEPRSSSLASKTMRSPAARAESSPSPTCWEATKVFLTPSPSPWLIIKAIPERST